jgi:hypothetical protein
MSLGKEQIEQYEKIKSRVHNLELHEVRDLLRDWGKWLKMDIENELADPTERGLHFLRLKGCIAQLITKEQYFGLEDV